MSLFYSQLKSLSDTVYKGKILQKVANNWKKQSCNIPVEDSENTISYHLVLGKLYLKSIAKSDTRQGAFPKLSLSLN